MKVRYSKELLLSLFPSEGKAKLIGTYEVINSTSRIKYKCSGTDCEEEGEKSFPRLYASGTLCNKCTFKKGSEKGIKTLQKKFNNPNIKNPMDVPGTVAKIRTTTEKKHGSGKQEQLGKNLAEHRKAHWEKEKPKWEEIAKKGTMVCCVCKSEKALDRFKKGEREFTTWHTRCYDCKNVKRTANTLEWSKTASVRDILKEQLYNASKRAIKKGKYICDITLDELMEIYTKQSGKCYISGRELKTAVYDLDRISIDRIDSKKGYTKDNVGLVCSQVNLMKLDMPVELLLEYVNNIQEHNSKYTTLSDTIYHV